MANVARDWWTGVCHSESLAGYTTFRVGGPADLLLVVDSEPVLVAATQWAHETQTDLLVLGSGSNVLVADGGVRGLVVINRASYVYWPSVPEAAPDHDGPDAADVQDEELLRAASGVPLGQLVRQAAWRGLGGLEWAVGIPGTLGGAIVQNAGAHGSSMAELVRQVMIIDGAGAVRVLNAEALGFGYRTSRFRTQKDRSRDVILSARLLLPPRPQDEVRAHMTSYVASRRATQPRLPSAGSVFKNPPGDYAGRLIEAAGLKGAREGDAMVAVEHANFIVNVGNARASDVKALIDRIRQRVAGLFGVELELEIQLVGDWHGSCSV